MRELTTWTVGLLLAVLLPGSSYAATQDAVVKIFTTAKKYDYDAPWQVAGAESRSGSGGIISGRRILTNAHVVSNATYIEVQRNGDPAKYVAKVLAVAHEADLALLQVEDDRFYIGVEPLELDGLPELLDSVVVYGFPEGGEGLSVTKGIVSRIELTHYVHSWQQYLGLQIDAAINSGNSGGPVIKDGKIVGIAMQAKPDAESMGYIVPTPIIEHVLADLRDGHYDGFPGVGVMFQPMENPALRISTGLPQNESGVYIYFVVPGSSADGLLSPGDVVLQVNNYPVSNDGTIQLRPGLRVSWDFAVTAHQMGGSLDFTVWRKNAKRQVRIPLKTKRIDSTLVKAPEYDRDPEYYIVGGIVFMPLSLNSFSTWGEKWLKDAPISLLKYLWDDQERTNEQVVYISGILKSQMTSGYGMAVNTRIVAVNGHPFSSFKEFTLMADEALRGDELITFRTSDHIVLTIAPREHRESEKRLLEMYGIDEAKRVR